MWTENVCLRTGLDIAARQMLHELLTTARSEAHWEPGHHIPAQTLPSPYTQAALSLRLPAVTSGPPVQPSKTASGATVPMGWAPRCTLKRDGASYSCISTIAPAPSEDPERDLAAYFPLPQRMPRPCPRPQLPQPQQAQPPLAQRTFRTP